MKNIEKCFHNFLIVILLQLTFSLFAGCAQSKYTEKLPGNLIAFSPASSERYIGSPSIVLLPDGKYLASHDFFGPKSGKNLTHVYESTDKGKTWKRISELSGQWWSSMYYHDGAVYIMGTSKEYGYCVIRRSANGGAIWTEPADSLNGLLLGDGEYHTAPMPFLKHNGRIWRAMEERNPPEKWGENFLSFVMSAPLGSDLLKASSWKTSNRLRYDQDWEGRAWLEGNILLAPQGNLLNILRCANEETPGRACVINISEDGEIGKFNPESGFINLPGGTKKFTIRFDSESGKYVSLANYIPEEFLGHKPSKTRNTLALISSTDFKNWSVNQILLQNTDVQHVGFQYVDWLFEGEDIISVIRTSFPDEYGANAHNAHDANHMVFYRIKQFRELLADDINGGVK